MRERERIKEEKKKEGREGDRKRGKYGGRKEGRIKRQAGYHPSYHELQPSREKKLMKSLPTVQEMRNYQGLFFSLCPSLVLFRVSASNALCISA